MDNLSKEDRRKNMQNICSENTKPERIVMKELKKRKIYLAEHVKKIIGKPDIVFHRKKVIVFIDSDFWHYNPDKFVMPNSNVEYWNDKIKRNIKRDAYVNSKLIAQGWKVIRIWESANNSDLDMVLKKIFITIGRCNEDEI